MNDLQIFNNEEFGEIRVVVINGEPWRVGKDVARALGYKDTSDALKKHVDKEDKGVGEIPTPGGRQNVITINKSGMYALILGSKLPSAKRFKHWVTSEVLPAIHETGYYEMPKKEKHKRNKLSSVNMMAKNITDVLKNAGVEPLFIAAEVARIYTDQGYEVQAPLVTDKETMPKLYDCTEIAKELGIMSKNGLPHNQAVSSIIDKLWITEEEVVTTAFSRNGHEDVTTQYLPSVVESVKGWLEENSYPTKIPFVDSKGNHKTRTVVYQRTVG